MDGETEVGALEGVSALFSEPPHDPKCCFARWPPRYFHGEVVVFWSWHAQVPFSGPGSQAHVSSFASVERDPRQSHKQIAGPRKVDRCSTRDMGSLECVDFELAVATCIIRRGVPGHSG